MPATTIVDLAKESIARQRFRDDVFKLFSKYTYGDPEFNEYLCLFGMPDSIEFAFGPSTERDMAEMIAAGILGYTQGNRLQALKLLDRINRML